MTLTTDDRLDSLTSCPAVEFFLQRRVAAESGCFYNLPTAMWTLDSYSRYSQACCRYQNTGRSLPLAAGFRSPIVPLVIQLP